MKTTPDPQQPTNTTQLDQVINKLPASIVILTGEDFIIEQTNPSNLAYWQRTREQVIGKPLLEALPELADQAFPGQLKQVLNDGITIVETEHPVRLEGADGSFHITYVDYSYQALTNNNGERTGVLVMSNDVTEKVESRRMLEKYAAELQSVNEEAITANEELTAINEELSAAQTNLQDLLSELAISESKYRNEKGRLERFFMQAPAGIAVLNGPELTFELVNPLYQQLFPGRDILGKTMLEAIPEVQGSPIWDVLQSVLQTGKTFEGHELLIPLARTDDGPVEDRYFDFIYQARFNEEKVPDGILVFVIEVTDQVDTKREILQAKENFRMAIQAGDMGTFSINTRTSEFSASPRMGELFGFKPDEKVTYEAFRDQFRADYQELAQNMVEDSVYRGARFELEYPVIGIHDGKERWLRAIGTTIPGSDGRDSYFTGTIIDITERRADDQRKNDFIGMVSHELKTPLTSLTALVQVVSAKLRTSEDQFLAGAMDKANVQVKKMSTMINGFLDVSRLESGKMLINKKEFALEDLIRETIKEHELIVTTHIIELNLCDHVQIIADREKIGSVITNLLSNAVKYSPKGKEVNVVCRMAAKEVTVSVRDQGMGIMENDLPHVFDRYFRAETMHTQHISGFGIGLYLSSEIIKQHQGKIWAESESGKGSTFYFSLPL